MTTIKKTTLKKIVKEIVKEIVREEGFLKECFVEVLREGINSRSAIENDIPIFEKTIPKQQIQLQEKKNVLNKNFSQNVKERIQHLAPKDTTLQSVFADTAMNTLQEQLKAESAPPMMQGLGTPDVATKVANSSNPEDLFVGSDRWAQLAFMPKKN